MKKGITRIVFCIRTVLLSLYKGDAKPENFGYYEGRLVCVDYG